MKSSFLRTLAFVSLLGTPFAQSAEELDSGTSESGKIAWKVVDKGEGKVLISEGDQGESAATVLTTTVAAGNT